MSSTPARLLCVGILLSGAALVGCGGQDRHDATAERAMESRSPVGTDVTLRRIAALEAAQARLLDRVQELDIRLQEERWHASRVAAQGNLEGSMVGPSGAHSGRQKADCSPPFYMDARGIKTPKIECM
jgi:hypothetical protein